MIPERLKIGDCVGVVSPSGAIAKESIKQLEAGRKFFENQGFKIAIAKNALSNSLGYSASPEEKAEDLNAMFGDKNINAIVCSQGGENANAILPLLDFKLIKKNPKIFLGISDITVLLNVVYSKTGLATFHGNDLMWGFGRNPTKYDLREFKERLIEGKIGKINKNSEWTCIKEGKASGILIGGNINCLNKLIGTKFEPDFRKKILFLESYGESRTADELDWNFQKLKQVGAFDKIRGLWLGYYKSKDNFAIETVAGNALKEFDFPILKCNDFGHNTPNTTIPIGVKVKLDASGKTVEILEKCVN